MKKSLGFGLAAALVVLMLGSVAFAQIYSVYNPVDNRNVPIDRVTMEELVVWISNPAFSQWTNMEGLEKYLQNHGTSLKELREKARQLSTREKLSLTGQKSLTKKFSHNLVEVEGEALTNIQCDLDDQELEFELTNVGEDNWFLVDQAFTAGEDKTFSAALTQANTMKLYVNNFLVNSMVPRYWLGEKLFYSEGETFAHACSADFVRSGRTVRCKIEPIPVRSSGVMANSYLLVAPGVTERGTFGCD